MVSGLLRHSHALAQAGLAAAPRLARRVTRSWLRGEAVFDAGALLLWRRSAAVGGAVAASRPVRAARRILRFVAGIASEGVTLGAAGLVLLLILAQPAMRETGPGWLKRLDLSVTFLDRDGNEIGRRGIRHDDRSTLDSIPPVVIQAVLATEDRRFFHHPGIDPVGLARALAANARASGVVQGGSTLTQQLAKNLFLSNERTLDRKIKEAFLALWLEGHYSKAEILQLYLDRAYMGASNFGLAAASQFYFGKPIAEATLPEAAMLAGLFKAPSRYAPHAHADAAEARAADVLAAMVEARAITPAEAAAARAAPARAVARPVRQAPDHFLDWAFAEVARRAAEPGFGPDSVLVVETGLDPALQRAAESAVTAALTRDGERLDVDEAAALVMEPDGAVRAMVGGRDYSESQFNRATDALRQPGSSFKPFVYTAALAAGFRPDTTVVDSEICIGTWCPQNYGRSYAGPVTLATALMRSINTIPVKLSVALGRAQLEGTLATPRQLKPGNLARLGRERIVEVARRMGIRTPMPDAASLPIGSGEVTLVDMVSAYAIFANGGMRAEPHAALAIRNSRGRVLWTSARARPASVLSPEIVADMNTMLARVPEAGTGRAAAIPGLRTAGKTGTTNAYRDAWYIGFTGDLVAGIWFGNDDHSPTKGITGGSLPAATWKAIVSAAGRPAEPRPIPGLEGGAALLAELARRAGPGTITAETAPPPFRPMGGVRATFTEVRPPRS